MIKLNKFTIALLWAAAFMISSCDDSNDEVALPDPEEEEAPTDKESEQEEEDLLDQNVLIGPNSLRERLRDQGLSGPGRNAAAGARARMNGTSPLSAILASKERNGRTSDCYEETSDISFDGSYEFTIDFGDGCTYEGEFLKGKLIEKGSISDDGLSFTSSVEYINFGGEDWLINGTYSYDGTYSFGDIDFDDDFTGDDFTGDDFSASFTFEMDITEQRTELEETDDAEKPSENVVEIRYTASGKEIMDDSGYTIESKEEEAKIGDEAFTSTVTSENPLHFNFECEGENEVLVFVTGIESGTYTFGENSGTWSIDYGDGTCDNLVTITEDGQSEEIDISEEFDETNE